jgi:hypothetical protein
MVLRITVSLALVAAPAVALASAPSNGIDVTNCNQEIYKPSAITIACSDGTEYLTKLKWSSWTRSGASGTGVDEVNPCNPDCAQGHFKGYAVTVKLSKPTSCHKQRHKVFNTLALTYTGSRPKGSLKSSTTTLGCPF